MLLLLGNERLGKESSSSLVSGAMVLDHYKHPLPRPHLSLDPTSASGSQGKGGQLEHFSVPEPSWLDLLIHTRSAQEPETSAYSVLG